MNEMFSQGGKGSTGILTNKQAVARHFGVKQSEIVYFSVGALLDGYKVIYDKVTQRAYSLPANLGSGVTTVSLSTTGVLVHSAGSVDLGELAVAREEFVTLPGSFSTGVTVNTKNELVVFTNGKYRWDGGLPKIVPAGSTPDSTGEVKLGAWISVGDASLRAEIAKNDGLSLIGNANYSEIRNYNGSKTTILCRGLVTDGDGGEGIFIVDQDDSSSPDNGGTVLVDASGRRWKRQYSGDVSVGWFLGGSGPSFDASTGFQNCINAYPYSRITVPYAADGYYFSSSVIEPQSASYQIIGCDGMQVNHQQLIYVNFNGPAFKCESTNTTFTKYQGIRFETNKTSYPLAQAILNSGFWVHGELKNITVKNFTAKALQFNGYNCCNFEQVLIQFNDDFGIYALAGAANTFDRIIGDNNNGGIMYTIGASNAYRNLYSEDCCKTNVSGSDTNPEFYFGGDAPTVTNLSINSYAGNATAPVKLDFCRNMTMIGVSNKSSTTPSYTYEIELTNQDSSLTLINSSGIRIKPGVDSKNTIKIDAGYSNSLGPSIIVGGYGRDIVKNTPIASVSFSADGTIYEAGGIASVVKDSTGTYTVNLAETVKHAPGIRITGCADADGYGNQAVVSEIGSARTASSVKVIVTNSSGTPIDCYHVSVMVYGTV